MSHSLLLFPAPSSVLMTVTTTASFVGLVYSGINEIRGNNMQYSKFLGSNSGTKIGTKAGMIFFYFPTFLLCAAALLVFFSTRNEDSRCFLVCWALSLHFLKRFLETLFVHKYTGQITIEAMVFGSLTYPMLAFIIMYTQYLSRELVKPSLDLKYGGLLLFFIGMSGNGYHHYLLSTLRKKGDKEYKIPKGGLFGVVVCPHYLFEVLDHWGLAFIAQTWCALGITLGITMCLIGRSLATRKWYFSKFEDFPTHVRAIIPYIL